MLNIKNLINKKEVESQVVKSFGSSFSDNDKYITSSNELIISDFTLKNNDSIIICSLRNSRNISMKVNTSSKRVLNHIFQKISLFKGKTLGQLISILDDESFFNLVKFEIDLLNKNLR